MPNSFEPNPNDKNVDFARYEHTKKREEMYELYGIDIDEVEEDYNYSLPIDDEGNFDYDAYNRSGDFMDEMTYDDLNYGD